MKAAITAHYVNIAWELTQFFDVRSLFLL